MKWHIEHDQFQIQDEQFPDEQFQIQFHQGLTRTIPILELELIYEQFQFRN